MELVLDWHQMINQLAPVVLIYNFMTLSEYFYLYCCSVFSVPFQNDLFIFQIISYLFQLVFSNMRVTQQVILSLQQVEM